MPISAYIYVAIALCTAFITHRVDGYYAEKAKVEALENTVKLQTEVVTNQATISQNTQKDKDDLQTRYDSAIAELRGLRNANISNGKSSTAPVPSQGLRLLESNAEFLIEFAKQCADTEVERNDVIQKYNALIKP
jgi:hypothetical protein